MHVGQGEIVSLLGRDGVGRSTTIKAIMAQVHARGSVKFKGVEFLSERYLPHCPQGTRLCVRKPDIFPVHTVSQNLILSMKGRGVAIVLVEQKPAIALGISQRVYMMGHAAIVFEARQAICAQISWCARTGSMSDLALVS